MECCDVKIGVCMVYKTCACGDKQDHAVECHIYAHKLKSKPQNNLIREPRTWRYRVDQNPYFRPLIKIY